MEAHGQAGRSVTRRVLCGALCTLGLLGIPTAVRAQERPPVSERGDSVTVRLIDVELQAAVQALTRYLDRPILFGTVSPTRVTLETPQPVPIGEVTQLLRQLLRSQGLELASDSASMAYVVRPVAAPPQVSPDVTVQQASAQVGSMQLFVIRLKHARAIDVSATVNALYGRASALGELGERRSTLTEQLQANQVPPVGGVPSAPGAVSASRPAEFLGEVTLVPDAGTNSLLIRALAGDFELIRAAVDELDIRPLQVLIEVMIAEVRRDRSLSIGLDLDAPPHGFGKGNATIGGSQVGASLGDFVLKVMNLGGIDLDATLRAASSRGDVSILSRPVVIASNNQEAEILVGSQRPFVQVSRSLPTDAASRDQIVQYKDVGTRLRVLPTISADGYVALHVTQEVNNATNETAFNAPVISTRSVQTELLIKDGQTIVLGGLLDRQRDRSRSGVPVLSRIPLIGGLFGQATRRTTDTELFVFLTPRVIRTDEDALRISRPLQQQAEKTKP